MGLLLLAAPALARHQTVSATGQAVLVGNPAQARSQAVAQAVRHAVEQVVTSLGGARDGDDGATDRAIYDHAYNFARATVAGEDADGNILRVDVTVDVDDAAIAAALGPNRGRAKPSTVAGGASIGGKRVLILATEQLGPHQIFGWTDVVWGAGGIATKTTAFRAVNEMGSMEAAFAGGFTEAGFDVIDPHVLRGKLAPKPAFEALDLSSGEARQIAQKSDADLVVVAKGTAKIGAGVGDMVSGQANVVARLVRIRDGKVLASTTQHAAQVHIDADTARLQAIDEATRMAAADLARKALN